MSIRLFIEGKADHKFLNDYIGKIFPNTNVNYTNVKGKDRLHLVKNDFLQNTDQGGVNLLIFDADEDYNIRKAGLEEARTSLGISFEVFLFPDNENPGTIETLLLHLTTEAHQGIFECFSPFNSCLIGKNPDYHVPDLKTQIYSYLAFQKLESKEEIRDYTLPCWNLNHEKANALKEFLSKHL